MRIAWWQTFATLGAFLAAACAAGFAWLAIGETRRIGETQARAFLSIQEPRVHFIPPGNSGELSPIVDFVVSNSGQSPATDFVFNVFVKYIPVGGGEKIVRERELGGDWKNKKGFSVPAANGVHRDGALISEMQLLKFLRSVSGAQQNCLMVGVRIIFEFDDVFGNHIVDEARFIGFHSIRGDQSLQETRYGPTLWNGELHQVPTSAPWHEPDIQLT